jgi:hypothetical protein
MPVYQNDGETVVDAVRRGGEEIVSYLLRTRRAQAAEFAEDLGVGMTASDVGSPDASP